MVSQVYLAVIVHACVCMHMRTCLCVTAFYFNNDVMQYFINLHVKFLQNSASLKWLDFM